MNWYSQGVTAVKAYVVVIYSQKLFASPELNLSELILCLQQVRGPHKTNQIAVKGSSDGNDDTEWPFSIS